MRSARAARRAASLLALALMLGPGSSMAGNQKEEALSDSVRLALARAIGDAAPPKPVFRTQEARRHFEQWRDEMARRLARRMPDLDARLEFLDTAWYEAARAGLDPGLVLGLIQVESNYRKYAISLAGARGYMQVMPFWARVIGDGDARRLFHMQANLRYGCAILRMYLDMERGDLFMALGRYNGSRGKPGYPNAVLAAWQKWQFTPPAG